MTKTKSVQISIDPSNNQYEWHDNDLSSSQVFKFSVEERHRLIAPSWYTSKNIEDYDDGEDDDIVQEVIQESVDREFGFSYNDFINRAYEKSVSDFISNVGFLSNDDECVKCIEDSLFRWVEKEMSDVMYFTVIDVKIVVLIREETNGEELTGHEFDGEFKSVTDIPDDDDQEEMAPAPGAPVQVEVDQEVIEIEDDEEEEEVPVVVEEEEDGDEARERLMETVFGSDDYMEVEDLGGGGGIEQRWEEFIVEENDYFDFANMLGGGEQRWEEFIVEENDYFDFANMMDDDGEGEQQWEGYVELEDNNWSGLSNRNGVSRDMIETLLKTREYDPKRDGDCMICMDGLSSKQEVVAAEMPCSHVFHKPCIVEWLVLKNSCPLCRFEICNKNDDPH